MNWSEFGQSHNWVAAPFMVEVGLFVLILMIWSLIWKGLGLWKAARHGHKWWFLAMLVINTAGILEILYIYVFSKGKLKDVMKPAKPVSSSIDDTPEARVV